MSNFRVYVTIDVEDSKGKAAIKDVKSKLDKIPGKKKIRFESNAQGLMGNLRDLTVVLGGVMRGYQMVKRAAEEVIKAQEKQIENEAKVRQGIKATGGAAGFQADQLIKLAAAWQQQYLIADEVLLDAQAKLLSFTNVTGERFTRTLMSAANVAIVMNDDINTMTQTVIQLGKALNDPLTGLTLLNKSGITFSEQQKEQINALVKNNQLLEAQGVILDELDNQYGGQAEALAALESGPLKAYRLALGDLKERMGAVANSILFDLVMTLKPFIEKITETKVRIGLLIGVAAGLILTVNKLTKVLKALGVVFQASTGWIGAAVTILGTLITGLILFTKTQRQANAERREAVKTLIDQNEHLIKQAKRYRDLRNQEVLTGAEEDELKSIREELISQHPELVRGTEDYERALNGLKLELESLNEEQLMLSLFEERKELKEFQKDITGAKNEYSLFMMKLSDPGHYANLQIETNSEQKAIKLKKTYDEIFKRLDVDLPKLTDESLGKFMAGAKEDMLVKINEVSLQLTEIELGRAEASKKEKEQLEAKIEVYRDAYNSVKNIYEVLEDTKNTEKSIDEIILQQILNRDTLDEETKKGFSTEQLTAYYEKYKFQDLQYFEWKKQQLADSVNAQEISDAEKEQLLEDHLAKLQQSRDAFFNKEVKEAMSPKDLAKYYNEVKFLDSEYFEWKKQKLAEEVEKMEITADQKRNLTNKLLDDLLDDYLKFYNISIDKFIIPLKLEIADPKNLEADINEEIEKLVFKPIQLPPHRPTTFDDDIRNLNEFFTTSGNVVSGIQDVWGQYSAYKSQLLQNEMNEEIQAVERSGLSEQDKQAKIQNIKEKFQQKEKEMYAKMKPVKIAMAISNTALGVTKAISAYPPPLNFIMAAIVAAAGALQVATIEAQQFEKGTDKIKQSDLLKIQGVDIGKEDGLVAVKKNEGIVSTEGTQHEFNRAMINLMNQGIDISNLIPQFETGTVMPSPDIHIKTGQSINDKNIIKALTAIVSEIRTLDEHFVEKEDREIREIKESKELEHEIEYIDKAKATEKLTELGNILGDIITAGTEVTPQSTEKAAEMILNIKKEFADPEPAEKPVSDKTDISEFEKALKKSIDRRTEFEQPIKEEPVHDKPDMSEFNKALTEFMNQGVDMAELIAQIGQDRVVVVPEVNIDPGKFDDSRIISVLNKNLESVKILKIINENLAEGKLFDIQIKNKSGQNIETQIRSQERHKKVMNEAGWHDNMEID